MSETIEQFLARFRATGLDMLCEARRRELNTLPPVIYWGRAESRWSAGGGNLQQIPKGPRTGRRSSSSPVEWTMGWGGEVFRSVWEDGRRRYVDDDGPRSIWKGASVGQSFFDPATLDFNTFPKFKDELFDIDYSKLEEMLIAHTPNREPVIISGDRQGGSIPRHSGFDRMFISGRRVGHAMHRLSAAAALATASMSFFNDDFWETKAWESQPKPPGRSLGPGKEVEDPNEMQLNRKRIEKDRKRKKLARRSRK